MFFSFAFVYNLFAWLTKHRQHAKLNPLHNTGVVTCYLDVLSSEVLLRSSLLRRTRSGNLLKSKSNVNSRTISAFDGVVTYYFLVLNKVVVDLAGLRIKLQPDFVYYLKNSLKFAQPKPQMIKLLQKIFLLTILLFSAKMQAQYILVPDSNFRSSTLRIIVFTNCSSEYSQPLFS